MYIFTPTSHLSSDKLHHTCSHITSDFGTGQASFQTLEDASCGHLIVPEGCCFSVISHFPLLRFQPPVRVGLNFKSPK